MHQITDTDRLTWYEDQHTLHYSLEATYVVDGVLLQRLRDGEVTDEIQAPSLRAAIDAAMKDFPCTK